MPPQKHFSDLVTQWAVEAHSLNAAERAGMLQCELEAAATNRRLRVPVHLSTSVEQKIMAERDLLENYSLSEDRCFESQVRQLYANNAVPTEDQLAPDAALELAVHNNAAALQGALAVVAELKQQAVQLGTAAEQQLWCDGPESCFKCIRKFAVAGEDADTTTIDTITFDVNTFLIRTIHRTLLPSHNPRPEHHIQFGSINYAGR